MNMRNAKIAQRQRGLTLVEIMVAIGISAILLTGVLQILVSSKQSYRVLEATARVQEAGRFAVNFIAEDLRMAGFTGCYRGNVASIDNILNNPDAFDWNLNTPLEGHEWNGAGWTPPLPAAIAGDVLAGTDVVVIRSLASDGVPVNRDVPGANINLAPSGDIFVIGDIIMVTDCNNASVFQITNKQITAGGTRILLVHSAGGGIPGNSSPPQLSNSFGPGSEAARIQVTVYYISTNESDEPALYRRILGTGGATTAQELIDGVENMQILYGEDTSDDGLANRYVAASDVVSMDNVVSARVSLLMRTEDNIASSNQTYLFNGASVTANDLRMRRVFTSTTKLRNRGAM